MLTESNFRKTPDHFILLETFVGKQHVFQETWLKQRQPLYNQNYLDINTIITLAYMQLSLSFCSVQLRSHIGHIMVSFASQISLL